MNKLCILLLVLLAVLACHHEQIKFMDTGILAGYDARMFPCLANNICSCPGGIFIEIRGSTYRFLELPKNSNIILDGSTKFPIKVKLNWEKSTSCPMDLIDINQIALF